MKINKKFVCKSCGLINENPKIKTFPTKKEKEEIEKEIKIKIKTIKDFIKIDPFLAIPLSLEVTLLRIKLNFLKYKYYNCKECKHKNEI